MTGVHRLLLLPQLPPLLTLLACPLSWESW